jgi:hypothetical protein
MTTCVECAIQAEVDTSQVFCVACIRSALGQSTTIADVKTQLAFDDTDTQCDSYRSLTMAKSGKIARRCCNCNRDIQFHASLVVSKDEVRKALESNAKKASLILSGGGSLYLGGFESAMNLKELQKNGVTLVVNTAGEALLEHFPKMNTWISQYPKHGIRLLLLNWIDSSGFTLSWEDVSYAMYAIHSTLHGGHGVLVHCAQGKSRSSSLVVAYLMNTRKVGFDSALAMVKAHRAMAEPNTGFESKLRGWTERIHAMDLTIVAQRLGSRS